MTETMTAAERDRHERGQLAQAMVNDGTYPDLFVAARRIAAMGATTLNRALRHYGI
jgi:hypothetical protein